MKILISGSSGLIGSALTTFLAERGHQILKLVRTRSDLKGDEISWDLNHGIENLSALENLDAVIHLAGENIGDSRWTKEKKRKIVDSRVIGTRLLCQALASLKNPPKVLISASAIGYYGNRGDEVLTEQSPAGEGFLADVCKKWEQATEQATEQGIRVVNLRFGMVLSVNDGALKKMLIPFKMGLGGKIGSGKQYISWIAIDDLLNVIDDVLQNESLRGPINVVSPNPVTNAAFTKALGQALHRPTFMHMPACVARWAFGEMADDALLASTRVEPQVLKQSGFHFSYPSIEMALNHILVATI